MADSILHSRQAAVTAPSGGARVVAVGMSQLVVSQDPREILAIVGLGSCLAVSVYDAERRVGAMLHAMLPRFRSGAVPTRFVDSGIQALVQEIQHLKVNTIRAHWYLAGGSQMLSSPGFQDAFQIGAENIKMARDLLQQMGVRPVETDLGGTAGRTVRLHVEDGKMTVRTVAGVERVMGPASARPPAR